MGDIADMLIEQMEYDRWCETGDYPASQSTPKCFYCNAKNLYWNNDYGDWALFNADNTIHICKGYLPSPKIVKKIISENIRLQREKNFNDLIVNFENHKKNLHLIDNETLLALYEHFIINQEQELNARGESWICNYISLLYKEILKRMTHER